MSDLTPLFTAVAAALDGTIPIEKAGREALLEAAPEAKWNGSGVPLPASVLSVMRETNAHPCCEIIAATGLQWAPPTTSPDPTYTAHSLAKVHVELLGPTGLVPSDTVRIGLYGMLPHAEYGIRTHPAEEIYIMLAGQADWLRGDAPYITHQSGERSHHPSMMAHASRTTNKAFMSVYVWTGDISTANYVYSGLPDKRKIA